MKKSDLKSYEEYESYLTTTLNTWLPGKRLALAAAMAERWLPAYTLFTQTENWGDLPGLQKALQAVWDHLCGRLLAAEVRLQLLRTVDDASPHMDDFDAYQALALCVILKEALEACASDDNTDSVVQCLLSGFEAANGDSVLDSDELPRVWKRKAVQKELGTQLDLIDHVAKWPVVDEPTLLAFRRVVQSALYSGPLIKPATPQKPVGPTRISNQEAFALYRKRLENQLSRPAWSPPSQSGYMLAMSYQSQWGARYLLRMEMITGKTLTGQAFQLNDAIAEQVLHVRNLKRDQADSAIPEWESDIRNCIALCLANPMNRYDAKSIEEPHGFGPSIRQLYNEAKRANATDAAAWQSVLDWASHRPKSWDAEDRRRKRGKLQYSSELNELLSQPLVWKSTGDLDFPWESESNGIKRKIRLNDFPDEVMYQCFVGETDVGSFHDWPANWQR